jgi:HEAT repeat protein
LLAALRDESAGVRYFAAVSLGMVGDVSALSALEEIRRNDTGVTLWGAKVSDAAARAIELVHLQSGWREAP